MQPNHLFYLLIAFLIPLILGHSIFSALIQKTHFNKLMILAVSFGLGMGMLAQWILILETIKLPVSLRNISFPLMTLSLALICLKSLKKETKVYRPRPGKTSAMRFPMDKSPGNSPFTALTVVLLTSFVIFQTYFVFWRAITVPIYSYDAIFYNALKAKILFFEGTLEQLKDLEHVYYPLQGPYTLSWVALNLRTWNDQWVKIIFPILFISYLIIQYYFICQYTGKRKSLIGIALFCSAAFPIYHATIAYNDFYIMYFNMLTIFFIIMGFDRDDRYFILAGLFAGFAAFTKTEGLGYLLINVFLLLIFFFPKKHWSFRKKVNNFVKFITPAAGMCLLFYIYKLTNMIPLTPAHMTTDSAGDYLARMTNTLNVFGINMFLSNNWNFLWALLVFSLLANRNKIPKFFQIKYLLMILILYASLYFFVSVFTKSYVFIGGAYTKTVLSRIILHFFPICPMLIVLLNFQKEQ